MKIKYLDGHRFYNAIKAGSMAVIKNQAYLNKINVFPVPDADTGTNMASTMKAIIEGSVVYKSLKRTLRSIADSALMGARGNSGIIFAQFMYGLSEELNNHHKISATEFAGSVKNAIKHVYDSILDPVEGTIITVMNDWADSIHKNSNKTSDFAHLLADSLKEAQTSLKNTTNQLKVLSDAGVVDAGAKGFVDFLEGVSRFIHHGKLKRMIQSEFNLKSPEDSNNHDFKIGDLRYCTEAILTDSSLNLKKIQEKLQRHGNSLIAAGSPKKMHIHIHTDKPAELFHELSDYGSISNIKVDDMFMQYQISHERKYPIALITDTACDLPKEILQKYQIQQIPFNINFGKTPYLDKVTITAEQFYQNLQITDVHPKSSQPSPTTVNNLFSFITSQYEEVIAIHISDKLSGVFGLSKPLEKKYKKNKIAVFNSKQLTVSEGLIVMRTAEAIEKGLSFDEITKSLNKWIDKTEIYVDINTLKYMVRGGRVSPLKGMIATALNLKPIVTLDKNGKAAAAGKSFSRKGNLKKILRLLEEKSQSCKIWNYAIVHADAKSRAMVYAEKLTKLIGKEPAYVMELSPVVGVHNGIGAIGIGIMEE